MVKRFKYFLIVLILALLLSVSMLFFACDKKAEPLQDDRKIYYTVEYIYPDFGGYYISGNRYQRIEKGNDGVEVTVVPIDGYTFVEWSDGVTTPTRREQNVQCDMNLTPIFAKIELSIIFNAEKGGYIEGETEQTINYGESSTAVTAVPDENHLFAGWSDGIMTETRIITKAKENLEASALFISKTKILRYEYDLPAVYKNEIVLSHGDLAATKFYIPEKQGYIFDGWYLDSSLTEKVTDGKGYYFRGNTIFYDDSNSLYPKWITEVNQTFKMLFVFIEEAHAQLPDKNKELFNVDYKMALYERKTYDLIPERISDYLNNLFENKVKFEVDTFFTTKPIGIESYYDFEYIDSNNLVGNGSFEVFAIRVPELFPILGDYRSIITTGGMNDFQDKIHAYGGIATTKYAYIAMESLFGAFIINNKPLESYLDPNNANWKYLIELYLHEFAHTIEEGYPKKDIHDVEKYFWEEYGRRGKGIELIGLYLKNKTIINGEIAGIPFDFWIGNTEIYVSYLSSSYNGKESGNIIPCDDGPNKEYFGFGRYVPFGSEIMVQAIPNEGWQFKKWSDGVTTSIRRDINIISRLRVFAIFEKIE